MDFLQSCRPTKGNRVRTVRNLLGIGIGIGIGLMSTLTAASARPIPVGISEKKPFYYPNDFADHATGVKTGWSTSLSTKQPVWGMWQNQEHALLRIGANQWLAVLMETNRIYIGNPGAAYVDAIQFLQYDDSILNGGTTPTLQMGFWRGNTMNSHPYVWAPCVLKEGGVWYMYYTALNPTTGKTACYLATSTTGSANPAEWIQYDPNSATPSVIEPIFEGISGVDIRDFHVIKVRTTSGDKFYCYYITNPTDSTLGVRISKLMLRISDSPTVWPDSGEQGSPAFLKINEGITYLYRLMVDYENPEVVQYEDGSFYLFISRHGQVPADMDENPDWKAIPLATEVYWSSDGLTFSPSNQLPNLRTPSGKELNAAAIIHDGSNWYATHAGPANNINYYEFDAPAGNPNPYEHSELFTKLVGSFDETENSMSIIEFEFRTSAAADSGWLYY